MDHETVLAYLDRVGVTAPAASDAAGLRTLHRAHQLTVPFENLSIHLAEPISLDEPDLIDKIVHRRRGGFCYELNGAFGALLAHLGYDVTLLAARVFGDGGALGPPYDHLALRVDLPDEAGKKPRLVDVGFEAFVAEPLRLDERGEQADPLGTVRLVETGEDRKSVV